MNNKFKLGDIVARKWRQGTYTVDEVCHITSLSGKIDFYKYKLIGGDEVREDDIYLVGKRPDGTPLQCNDVVVVLSRPNWDDITTIKDILYCEIEGVGINVEGVLLADNRIVKIDEVVYWGTVGEVKDGNEE